MSAHSGFAFGPFQLDPLNRQVYRDGSRVPLSRRHIDVLVALLTRAGHVLSKDQLITAAWQDVSVGDNSLEKAVSSLRRSLGSDWIATERQGGYRFVGDVARIEPPANDAAIDALLAPHRAWIEGRAALETLEGTHIQHARGVFERVLATAPNQAPAHVGLANACVFAYEMTRADRAPDAQALADAELHAREACRLDLHYGEAWATLGFVLDRTGRHDDARAALRRAVMLEPDNWRHHLRLSYGSWGEERLRAAHRTLSLMPGFPMAHWLVSTVHIARQAFFEATRELGAGLTAQARQAADDVRFGAVALHWLSGLLDLRDDEDDLAMAAFTRELANEASGLLYSRECCANTHYAIGALHLRRGRVDAALQAFDRALALLPHHPLVTICRTVALLGDDARVRGAGAAGVDRLEAAVERASGPDAPPSLGFGGQAAIARAVLLSLQQRHGDAADVIVKALDAAPPGPLAWLLPVEPVLNVAAHPEAWAPALARLRARAA